VAEKLVSGWFLEIKLENGLSHVQKCIEMYGNVWNCTEVYGKGGRIWEKWKSDKSSDCIHVNAKVMIVGTEVS